MSQIVKGSDLIIEIDNGFHWKLCVGIPSYKRIVKRVWLFFKKVKWVEQPQQRIQDRIKPEEIYYLNEFDETGGSPLLISLSQMGVHPNGRLWQDMSAQEIDKIFDKITTSQIITNSDFSDKSDKW